MKDFKRIFLLVPIFFYTCYVKPDYKEGYKNSLFLNLILLDTIIAQNRKFIFENFNFSYSSNITKNISGTDYSICIDIFKNKGFDQNRIITGYEGNESPNRCNSISQIQFRCMQDATLFIEVQNFSQGSNTDLVNYCRNTLKGIIAF